MIQDPDSQGFIYKHIYGEILYQLILTYLK